MKEKKISSEIIYKGKILTLEKDKVLCPNGNLSTKEVIRHKKVATILAKIDNKYILERQYRYPYDEIMWELPAGKVEENESLEETIIRELEEEAGYKAMSVEYLGKIYPTCAYSDEVIYIYFTDNLIKTKQRLDTNENIEIYLLSMSDIEDLILNDSITDAKILSSIALAKIFNKI